jgi:hypothetical protein
LKCWTDQILECCRSLHCIRESEDSTFNFFVGFLDILRLKRRSSVNQRVNYHSKTPNINFTRMTFGL